MFPAGSLLTHNCKVDLCPVCLFHQFPVELQLRGVCLDSPVDKFYVLHSSGELHGQGGSRLRWEEVEGRWRITRGGETLARTHSERRDLPLGVNTWLFSDSSCTDPASPHRRLSLHVAVPQPGHFCCEDGLCLESDCVCDGNQDCEDRTDERDCTMLTVRIS